MPNSGIIATILNNVLTSSGIDLSTKADLVNGLIPSAQLPSYVDDVLEFANLAAFPATGETSKIYIALDTNKSYRWGGSSYIEIVSSPGTTDAVAEGTTNLYYTNTRARAALSFVAGSGAYNSTTGVITIPTNTNQLTNGAGFITGYTETDTLASVTARGATTSTNLTLSGRVEFSSAVATRPQMPGGILGIDTGDGNFDIWGISRDYYPSNPTASNAWGILWNGDTNQVRFIGGGAQRLVIDLDGGSTGALTWEGNSIWHAGNLTNLNQLTNGPGYISSYTETDTLASVTGRGATTSTLVAFLGKTTLGNRSSAQFNGNVTGLTINNTAEIRSLQAEAAPALTFHYESLATRHILMNGAGTLDIVAPSNENGGVAVLNINGNVVWHAGNDGSGSNLDADLLDGNHASAFALSAGNTSNAFGVLSVNFAQTQYNPSAAARTSLSPMSLKMWDNYFASTGLGWDYGTVMEYYSRSGHTDTQVYYDASGESWYRTASYNAAWQSWRRYITDANITSYAPTLTGSGASGTWGISITGNAATTTILAGVNVTSNLTSTWNPQSLIYQAFGQRWVNTNISNDSGDLVLWLRPSQYSASATEVCMMIDGDYYAGTGVHKVLHAGNYNSYSPTLTGTGASGTWGINVTGSAGSVAWSGITSKPTTISGFGITDAIKTNATLSGNIDLDWGESFTTFDPVPTGTPPVSSPNIRTVNIGNNFARRTQLAFPWDSDQFFFRRNNGSWQTWREVLHSGNYNSYALPLAGGTMTGGVTFSSATTYTPLKFTGGVADYTVAEQDGAGRVNWYWNKAGSGGSPTYQVANEDALRLKFSTSQAAGSEAGIGVYYAAASGTAGAAITWVEVMGAFHNGFRVLPAATFSNTVNIASNLTVDTNTLFVDATNNRVGIGTTSPAEPFHVYKNATDAAIQVQNSTFSAFLRATTDGTQIGTNSSTLPIYFYVGAAERMRISSGGQVGIGNSVAATVDANNGSGTLVVGSGSGAQGLTILSGSAAGNEARLTFANASSGAGSYSAQITYKSGDNAVLFYNQNAERMRITSGGNLLIGTTSDTGLYKLDVNGTSRFSGTLRVDSGSSATSVNVYSNGDFVSNWIGNSTVQLFSIRNNSAAGVYLNTQNSNTLYLGVSSATTGGTTVNHLAIASTGAATFSSSVTASSFNGTSNNIFSVGGSEKARIDTSGNLGLGVTPSAWTTSNSVKALQLSTGSIYTYSTDTISFGQNVYITTALGNTYVANGTATSYGQSAGGHYWYIAPSGTAGAAITFTQAMTLNASGRLLLGTTTDNGIDRLQVSGSANISGLTTIGYSSAASTMGLFITNSAGSATGNSSDIWFGNWGGASISNIYNARISAINTNTSNAATDLLLYTYSGSGSSAGVLERMRITSGGRILMNTTTDDTTNILQVAGSIKATTGIDYNVLKPTVTTVASTATLTPNLASGDTFAVTDQTTSLNIAAPTGSPVNGQKMILRIRGTAARALSWNAIYRASSDLPLPTTTTTTRTMYLGFIYNSVNARWDLIAFLDNFAVPT